MRAVLDTNVIISAALSPGGAPAKIIRAWLDGAFELVASDSLLSELARALSYPKLRQRIGEDDAAALVRLVADSALLYDDPAVPPLVTSPDPDDNYVIALAAAATAVIVTGDDHLLRLADHIPVHTPAAFLGLIDPG